MGFEQLKRMAGVEILHVPSRTSTVPDILGGHVTASFMNILVALPHVREGTMKALAVSGSARASAAEQAPRVAKRLGREQTQLGDAQIDAGGEHVRPHGDRC